MVHVVSHHGEEIDELQFQLVQRFGEIGNGMLLVSDLRFLERRIGHDSRRVPRQLHQLGVFGQLVDTFDAALEVRLGLLRADIVRILDVPRIVRPAGLEEWTGTRFEAANAIRASGNGPATKRDFESGPAFAIRCALENRSRRREHLATCKVTC